LYELRLFHVDPEADAPRISNDDTTIFYLHRVIYTSWFFVNIGGKQ
jgi:hypothetical protein